MQILNKQLWHEEVGIIKRGEGLVEYQIFQTV
jgi:hypothetical protein